MKVYKIRDENGLYSTGGQTPEFNKNGKIWNNIGHVKNHLRQLFDRTDYRRKQYEMYDNAEIIAIEISETELEKQPVPDLIIEMLENDLPDMEKRRDNYPQSTYYAESVIDVKNHIMLLKAKRNENRTI